jgi:hypothetical protein
MSKNVQVTSGPDWDRLYEIALAQEGHFTTAQATEAGYYPQLLAKYLRNGKIVRIRRGIYRLAHFPASEHEDLVVVWLWTERVGVFSHETALALHGLSDVLPARVHVSLPSSWSKRRLRVPRGVMLHFADVEESDRTWVGAIRVTTVDRTLTDIVHARVSPDLVCDAFEEAVERGLLSEAVLLGFSQPVWSTISFVVRTVFEARMTARTYESPAAFKQALEHRLRFSSESGVDFARRRQLLVFDRFLARVVQVKEFLVPASYSNSLFPLNTKESLGDLVGLRSNKILFALGSKAVFPWEATPFVFLIVLAQRIGL